MLRRLVLAAVAIVAAYFIITSSLVVIWMRRDEHPHVGAIVVLGAAQYDGRPSPILAARLTHALALYREGVAPLLVFTGGKQPGDRYTEGWTGRHWAIAHAVPSSATLAEQTSRSTYENLRNAKRLLDPLNIRRVVLVSDPFHMFRSVHEAESLGLTAYPSPTRTSPISHEPVALTLAILREDVAIGAFELFGDDGK